MAVTTRKRAKRTQSDDADAVTTSKDSEQLSGPKRHDTLWLEDGNIILRAQDVLFKVHRSMLSRHSPIFRDLFELAQPDSEESLDGLPVINLEDSHYELADFLDTIYDGGRFYKHGARPKYVTIQSLLRLGSKYGVDELRAQAMHFLKNLLSTKLTKWDNFASWSSAIQHERADIISMANLTSELGLHQMRSRALYRCCQLSSTELVEGILHSRGMVERLSSLNMAICFDARQRLIVHKISLTALVVVQLKSRTCADANCRARRSRFAQCSPVDIILANPDPLEPPSAWLTNSCSNLPGSSLCSLCQHGAISYINSKRQELVAKLDPYFQHSA